ncbi:MULTISPECIES: hypothetical protein [Methylobacterium]|jgi:hypothetical protein|uniref:Uncharacterized protein n=1 Tax=Methylobacterium longum TaxID=767694 RepID=A0ABT8ATR0_9HYPH|nr:MULTISPECIES: hypothetical protein [Methylobacterium]MCJ2100725.1 hypothetical protein [Methylobacterium sp. E-046]MDN3572891.1 hypothetical protein [Methylobacterium longum]GJE09985.1 hypothetical protein FOHLNKBM_1014 [Methylobacterium longum]
MFDDAAARRYLAGLAPVAAGSVRWLIYDHDRQWVSVVDGKLASLRQDCAHVLSAPRQADANASYMDAIREFLADGAECTPQVVALSCAVLMQRIGDLDEVFAQIRSGVMATLVYPEDVVVRPVAA